MPSIKDVDKLIINTVENEAVYKYMEDNNLLQEDELYLVAGDSLPPITEEDNGKVLGVTDGEWQVVDQTSPLTPGTDYLTPTQISNSYVAKVNGKGLSTNDLTNELKAQYDKAEQNVQSNWNETNTSSDAYILNKPNIPTKMSDLEQDVETGKIDAIKVNNVAQTITDKTVNISVPTALSQLTGDTTHRLVTDAEKTAWNNKVDVDDIPEEVVYITVTSNDAAWPLSSFSCDKTFYEIKAMVDAGKIVILKDTASNSFSQKNVAHLFRNGDDLLVFSTIRRNGDAILELYSYVFTPDSNQCSKAVAKNVTSLSQLSDDATHRLVTDEQITKWNNSEIPDEYVYADELVDSNITGNPLDAGTLGGYSASDFQLKSQMPAVPTKVSQLSNDRGYVTNAELPTVPRFTSQLINDSGFIDNAPTKLSELSNDSGFITSGDLPDSSLCITVTNNSGQFSADKTFTEIKAAYDAHQYIYVITSNMGPYVYTPYMVTDSLILFTYMIAGSTTVTTFTMSVTSVDAWGYNVTSSNTIPAKTSDLTNDSGFITSSSLSSYAPLASPTFTGAAKVSANANYTTAQLRNVIISTADPSGGSNGDIWIKYEA